jgi:hypothetical protein
MRCKAWDTPASPPPTPPAPISEIVKLMRQHADDIWHQGGHQDCARTLADYANRLEQVRASASRTPPQEKP